MCSRSRLAYSRERPRRVAGAELRPRLALPRLTRPMDRRQLRGRRALRDLGEQAAGADRRELRVITDQQQLRPRLARHVDQLRQAPRVRHPRLVDDDHRPPVETEPTVRVAGRERVDGHRLLDPGVSAQPLRRRARDGRADHAPAVALPRLPRRADHDALPGPGLTDQHRDTAAAGDGLERVLLLAAQRAAELLARRLPRRRQRRLTHSGRLAGRQLVGQAERPLLELAQLARRPPPAVQLDQLASCA